ncbi:DUF298 domain-containing protein [Besnoitia besnoiti]|uniref:Defective in cullin neddylation protein n=1 Tax=Besnoitia besnoiti TaxID=94643 RepID=A0A2A9MN03_BESBE|nr:DUF298 domain-containing protein [Besnoitia besnoiti]PFH37213.1 DUF298 domain-containing protein [Besnoitia besnoiti]
MASRGQEVGPSGRTQQTLVASFQSVTGCTNRTGATDFLRKHNFDLSRALDAYFSLPSREQKALQQTRNTPSHSSSSGSYGGVSASSSARERAAAKAKADEQYRAIVKTFQAYADAADGGEGSRGNSSAAAGAAAGGGSGAIEVPGLERLAEDLGVGLDDVFFLIFAFLCGCTEQGRITQEEFTRGMDRAGVCTVAALREAVPAVRASLAADKSLARQVYSFAFTYSLDVGQKALPLDLCVAYWRLLLLEADFPLMTEWHDFIEEELRNRVSALSKDPWLMLFDFMHSQGRSLCLDEYDEDGAWPLVIDEFVDWARRRRRARQDSGSTAVGQAVH